jgi:hypothetical protein
MAVDILSPLLLYFYRFFKGLSDDNLSTGRGWSSFLANCSLDYYSCSLFLELDRRSSSSCFITFYFSSQHLLLDGLRLLELFKGGRNLLDTEFILCPSILLLSFILGEIFVKSWLLSSVAKHFVQCRLLTGFNIKWFCRPLLFLLFVFLFWNIITFGRKEWRI